MSCFLMLDPEVDGEAEENSDEHVESQTIVMKKRMMRNSILKDDERDEDEKNESSGKSHRY